MERGLSSESVAKKRKEFGFNELSSSRSKNGIKIAIEVIKEPMLLLLIACGTLYILIGDYNEGIVLLSTIFIIISITFFQHNKTEKALEALKKLSSPRALVIRDGVEIRISGREVVPGDYVIVNEGDRIPADGKLIESLNLHVDESIITGESLPVVKDVSDQFTLLSGTLVNKGRGIMIVEHIGKNTQFGIIGQSLEDIGKVNTPLQAEMKKLIRVLGIIGVLLCLSVVSLYYFTRGNLIQSILNGLAAAMSILPEEFPVVLTVFLALGAWRLSKKNVLTRNPSAIETLGSATVLCSDKTGTITQNKMLLAQLYSENEFRKRNTFDSLQNNHLELLKKVFYATSPDSIDPMEKAIILAQTEFAPLTDQVEFIKEYPFSHELTAMTRVYKDQNNTFIAYMKGAPETILDLCKLNEHERGNAITGINQIASEGQRVIGVASAVLIGNELPENQESIPFVFNGLIGLEDPIRPEVPAAIEECKRAGIRVIMITGDFPETAKNIGAQIGLNCDKILTGSELELLTDSELDTLLMSISILARVKPEQKLRIVESLKRNKEIVAMTGDGVNDAPALKSAHIGIAMGNKGTDVAREAASLVLLDDNFTSIVAAIRMGRKIFDNLQKAMSYILAIHIPIIGLSLFPAFFPSFPLLLMPLHIVFMELIIDPVSSVAFESEDEEKKIMERKPRDPSESFFGKKRIMESLFHGLLLFAMVMSVYFISNEEHQSEEEIRAIAFSALIIGNIFLILSKLSTTKSFIHVLFNHNLPAKLILLFASLFLGMILLIPGLSSLFNLKFPGFLHIFLSFGSAGILLFILEFIKSQKNKKIKC